MNWKRSLRAEDHAEKCVERYCDVTKDVSSVQQVAKPCIHGHLIPLEDYGINWRALCSLCLECCEMHVSGKNNTQARSVTKWSDACDKRLPELINYINQTKYYRQLCHLGNQIEDCKLGHTKMLH